MKIQIRSLLFALVLPITACGGDREANTVAFKLSDYVVLPTLDTPPPMVTTQDPVITKLVDVAKPMPTKFDELLVEGKQLVTQAKYGEAKIMFEAAAKLDRKHADPHIELARMYITMNEKGFAVASANKGVKLAPLSSQAWNTKGRAELTAHKYEDAIAAFSKSVELNADNVFAWNNLGYTELLLKRYSDAAEHLKEATSRPGATGYMFNNLGTALEQLDELDDARVAYEAGGNLGSPAAASSRKRLEGVDSVAVAVAHDEPDVGPQVKEYELVNESDLVEEATEIEVDDGSGASDEDGAQTEPTVEPGDNATL